MDAEWQSNDRSSGRNVPVRFSGASLLFIQIKELMKKLHIQVDNLCQFLPQEKVAEFTNMSKCDLLENTEKCVGHFRLASTLQLSRSSGRW